MNGRNQTGKKYYSIKEAAIQTGLGRRTIQRYIENKSIRWHGKKRMGSKAAGIDLEEVYTAASQKDRSGKDRAKSQPALKAYLTTLKNAEVTIADFVWLVCSAIEGGADIDLLAHCMRRIRDGDENFARKLMGQPVNALLMQDINRFTVDKLRYYSQLMPTPDQMKKKSSSFLWAHLVKMCQKASISVQPCVVIFTDSRTGSLEFCPDVFLESGSRYSPLFEGKHSVVSPKYIDPELYKTVSKMLTEIAQKVSVAKLSLVNNGSKLLEQNGDTFFLSNARVTLLMQHSHRKKEVVDILQQVGVQKEHAAAFYNLLKQYKYRLQPRTKLAYKDEKGKKKGSESEADDEENPDNPDDLEDMNMFDDVVEKETNSQFDHLYIKKLDATVLSKVFAVSRPTIRRWLSQDSASCY